MVGGWGEVCVYKKSQESRNAATWKRLTIMKMMMDS